MNVLIVTIIILGLSITVKSKSKWDSDLYMFSYLIVVITGLVSSILLISIFISRAETFEGIAQFESIRDTFEASRSNKSENIERFSRLDEIIQANKWLAGKKYMNETSWDLWVPDEVSSIKPIK